MRDSNSHEFEEMVDPITCTPNEEPEENIVEIDETFSEKESSFTKRDTLSEAVVSLRTLVTSVTWLISRTEFPSS